MNITKDKDNFYPRVIDSLKHTIDPNNKPNIAKDYTISKIPTIQVQNRYSVCHKVVRVANTLQMEQALPINTTPVTHNFALSILEPPN